MPGTDAGTLASRNTGNRPPVRDRIGDWIFPPRGAEPGPVVLGQRRVYILPTRAGLVFGLTLVLILIGAINYNLSLAYILAFLLSGSAVVSILHCWRNLARITLRPGRSPAVFAGEVAQLRISVENSSTFDRLSLAAQPDIGEPQYFDVPARARQEVSLLLPTSRRGLFRPGRFRIFTTYPLGLFYAWALLELDLSCVVYPRPEPGKVSLPPATSLDQEGVGSGPGEEDFSGLRTFHRGDSPRRIAWKAFARNEIMLAKQFSGSAGSELWLRYEDLPSALGIEGRLSRLTRWILDCESGGLAYGLSVPGTEIAPSQGSAHRDQCLQVLAFFEAP